MKGIVLHGGHGTRLRPLTHTGPKQLLTIANKPMSQYPLEYIRDSGIKDIAIVIGDIYPEKVQEFYGDGKELGINITYIKQDQPKGISHAIKLCKEFVGNDKFIAYLGDNILRKDLTDYKEKFEKSKIDAFLLLCEVDNPSRYGIAEVEGKKITKIIEKPKHSQSNLCVIGIYFLTPKIFDIIEKLKPSWRGELEITDALQLLMENNGIIEFEKVTGWWKDMGTPDDILHANKLVLDGIKSRNDSKLDDFSKIGNFVVGKNCTISRDSVITGPVIIGDNCTIGPSVRIGPYVSVGSNTVLKNCDLENSIVMNDCKIYTRINIENSIIATGSTIKNSPSAKKYQFLLGERSQLKL